MFLTRMGRNARFIVTGDVTQVDLLKKSDSGLVRAMRSCAVSTGSGSWSSTAGTSCSGIRW